MPNDDGLISAGMTVNFAGVTADLIDLIDVDGPEYTREKIDFTHQATYQAGQVSAFRAFKPAKFVEANEVTLTLALNGSFSGKDLIKGASGTLVITEPVPDDMTTGSRIEVEAFVGSVSRAGALGEKRTVNVSFHFAGEPEEYPAT